MPFVEPKHEKVGSDVFALFGEEEKNILQAGFWIPEIANHWS